MRFHLKTTFLWSLGTSLVLGCVALSLAAGNSDASTNEEAIRASAPMQREQILLKLRSLNAQLQTIAEHRQTSQQPVTQVEPEPVQKPVESGLLAVVDRQDILLEHRILSDRTLRNMPELCYENVITYDVDYNAKHRGLGGKTTIIIDGSIENSLEFAALIVHECAHVMHGNFSGNAYSGPSNFRDGRQVFYNEGGAAGYFAISWHSEEVRKKEATEQDFASRYGMTNAFEDLAEMVVLVALHPEWADARAAENPVMAEKIGWVREHWMPEPFEGAHSQVANRKEIPWDMTRMAYTLDVGAFMARQ